MNYQSTRLLNRSRSGVDVPVVLLLANLFLTACVAVWAMTVEHRYQEARNKFRQAERQIEQASNQLRQTFSHLTENQNDDS